MISWKKNINPQLFLFLFCYTNEKLFFSLLLFLPPSYCRPTATSCSTSSSYLVSCWHLKNRGKKLQINTVKESDSDTIIMVIVLVAGVGGVFILFALMALCYRWVLYCSISKWGPQKIFKQKKCNQGHPTPSFWCSTNMEIFFPVKTKFACLGFFFSWNNIFYPL